MSVPDIVEKDRMPVPVGRGYISTGHRVVRAWKDIMSGQAHTRRLARRYPVSGTARRILVAAYTRSVPDIA
eukprot:320368-Rhodomonas_salina.1